MTHDLLKSIFGVEKPVIGMAHLAPTPGAPGAPGGADDMERLIEAAVRDAQALERGGAHGVLVENFGDAPYFPDRVDPACTAAMTRAVVEIRRACGLPVGVNVLRNDAAAALGIARACGCAFVRVNVHCGARATDQGVLEGKAAETLRFRKAIGAAGVALFADVAVKHSAPLGARLLEEEALEVLERGLADAVIFTGSATGVPPLRHDVERVRKRLGGRAPILVGSGAEPGNAAMFLTVADGLIVGSWIKEDGDVRRPVSEERTRRLVMAALGA